MYSTRRRVHARIPNGHPREKKRASDKSRRTSRFGLWRAERAAPRQADFLAAAGRADFRARILRGSRQEVRVGTVEFKLNGS